MTNIVKLTPTQMNQIAEHAHEYWEKERINSSTFGDANDDKRLKNVVIGKMAEVATQMMFKTTAPDFEIWGRGVRNQQTQQADLTLGDYAVHVKATDYDRIGQESWIASTRTDHIVTAPTPKDLLCLCVCNVEESEVEIVALLPAEDVKSRWGECQSAAVTARGKRALYFNRLRSLDPEYFLRPMDD